MVAFQEVWEAALAVSCFIPRNSLSTSANNTLIGDAGADGSISGGAGAGAGGAFPSPKDY